MLRNHYVNLQLTPIVDVVDSKEEIISRRYEGAREYKIKLKKQADFYKYQKTQAAKLFFNSILN